MAQFPRELERLVCHFLVAPDLGKKTTKPKLIGQGRRARNMPGGSEWRIGKLLIGTLVGMKRWPDGTSKEVTIVPARVFPLSFPINPNVGNQPQEQSSEVENLLP